MHFTLTVPLTLRDLRAFDGYKARIYCALKAIDERNLLDSANNLYVAGERDEAIDAAQVVVNRYYNQAVASPNSA